MKKKTKKKMYLEEEWERLSLIQSASRQLLSDFYQDKDNIKAKKKKKKPQRRKKRV